MRCFSVETIRKDKKVVVSIALCVLLIFTLHGYVSTMMTFFNPENSDRLEDSILRAGAYGGGGPILLPLPAAWEVDALPVKDAYNRLARFSATEIAGVLNDVMVAKTALILPLFDSIKAINIIKAMEPEVSSEVLLLLDQDLAVEIISSLGPSDVGIIENMIEVNLSGSAIVIEEVVKELIQDLGEAERVEALEKLATTLSEVTPSTLLELFIEISSMPDTPSTVAYLLEAMNLVNSANVVESWAIFEDHVLLCDVFQYFSVSYLSEVWSAISGEARGIVYPCLGAVVQGNIPSLGEFQVSNLITTPSELEIGDTVAISFTLNNIGSEAGSYSIFLKINGVNKEGYTGFLGSGESASLSYTQVVEQEGEYDVIVGGSSVKFTVSQTTSPVKPANIVVSSVSVTPTEVSRGEDLLIVVEVSNTGEESGSEVLHLTIDGVVVDSKTAQVTGGAKVTIFFDTKADYEPGVHEVKIKEKTASFEVTVQSANFPWVTVIVTGVVVVGGGVYILYQRGIIKLPKSITSLIKQ